MLRAAGLRPSVMWATLSCAVLMLSPWLCAGGMLGDQPVDVEGIHWQVIWLTVGFLGAAVIHLRRGGTETGITDVAATLLIVLYLGFLPSFAIQLRSGTDTGNPIVGAWTLLVAHSPDILLRPQARRARLIFAGHTHGGQVRLPLLGSLVTHTRLGRRFLEGVHRLDDTVLVISRGVGVTRLPIRLGCPPEVTTWRLTRPALSPAAPNPSPREAGGDGSM